jgi:hypothetical protein
MGEVHMSKGKVGEDRGSKETDGCPLTHGWTITSPLFPDIIDIDDTRLQEMKHSLGTDGDNENTCYNLSDHITK